MIRPVSVMLCHTEISFFISSEATLFWRLVEADKGLV